MTARVHTQLEFLASAYFEGSFYVNLYEVDLTMNVGTDSIVEQNIALERVKYFVQETLTDCVFVSQAETQVIEKYINADLKVCTLPEDPYDQVVGIMLLVKLNAITEGRLEVTDITIGSRLSDGVNCLIELEDSIGPFESSGWWNECSCKINNITIKSAGKKVVKLVKHKTDWADVYLAWDMSKAQEKAPNSEVLFASFDNKSDK